MKCYGDSEPIKLPDNVRAGITMLQRFDLTLFGELSYVSGGGQIIHEIFQFNGPNRPIWVEHISNQTIHSTFGGEEGTEKRSEWQEKKHLDRFDFVDFLVSVNQSKNIETEYRQLK